MPVFGPGGGIVAAVELRVGDLARDVPAWRPALAVAAAALSRELSREIGPHSANPLPRSSLVRPVGLPTDRSVVL
jgi:hypothetical protein